jgi:hypothetical protein
MEFKGYDFTRNPAVQNEVLFLQSKCADCGFSILVRSLKNWSNTKSCAERNVARQTPPHTLPSMRDAALNCRIVKILTLLMIIILTLAGAALISYTSQA